MAENCTYTATCSGAERIGILGGTFDPPHNGHLALARGVARELDLSRVLFMPTGNPNFKQGQNVTPAAQRVEMVRRAIAEEPLFELDEREVLREGVTYTVDTLLEMRAEMPVLTAEGIYRFLLRENYGEYRIARLQSVEDSKKTGGK